MSDEIVMNLPFPLDDDGFFRRECPLCCREFKVWLKKEELADIAQKGIDSFMLEQDMESVDVGEISAAEIELTCPYCGQRANRDSWWTKEQLAYIGVVAGNIAAKIINENLIRPLKRKFRGSRSGLVPIRFEGKEIEQKEPWISPEVNDMQTVDLPCCKRQIKVEEGWTATVYCFFCGFPHRPAMCRSKSG